MTAKKIKKNSEKKPTEKDTLREKRDEMYKVTTKIKDLLSGNFTPVEQYGILMAVEQVLFYEVGKRSEMTSLNELLSSLKKK